MKTKKTKLAVKIQNVRLDDRIFDIKAPAWVTKGEIASVLLQRRLDERLRSLNLGHTLSVPAVGGNGYFEIHFELKREVEHG